MPVLSVQGSLIRKSSFSQPLLVDGVNLSLDEAQGRNRSHSHSYVDDGDITHGKDIGRAYLDDTTRVRARTTSFFNEHEYDDENSHIPSSDPDSIFAQKGGSSSADNWDLEIARTYILDAVKGRSPHLRIQKHDKMIFGIRVSPLQAYNIIHHRWWRRLCTLMVIVNLLLAVWEWDHRFICTCVEAIIMVSYLIDVYFRAYSHDKHAFVDHGDDDAVLHEKYTQQYDQNNGMNTIINFNNTNTNHNEETYLSPKTAPSITTTNTVILPHVTNSFNATGSNTETVSPQTRTKLADMVRYSTFSDKDLNTKTSPVSSHVTLDVDVGSSGSDLYYNNQNYTSNSYNTQSTASATDIAALSPPHGQGQAFKYTNIPYTLRTRVVGCCSQITWSKLRLFFIIITLIDILGHLVFVDLSHGNNSSNFFRITRLLRPFFLIEKGRVLRKLTLAVLFTLPPIFEVVALIGLNITIFGLSGYFLFSKNALAIGPNPFFVDVETSVYSMVILMSTANFPDVMMASYSKYNITALFFIIYLIIALYLLFNIVLAAVYSRFQEKAQDILSEIPRIQTICLCAAFEILCDHDDGFTVMDNKGKIIEVHEKAIMIANSNDASKFQLDDVDEDDLTRNGLLANTSDLHVHVINNNYDSNIDHLRVNNNNNNNTSGKMSLTMQAAATRTEAPLVSQNSHHDQHEDDDVHNSEAIHIDNSNTLNTVSSKLRIKTYDENNHNIITTVALSPPVQELSLLPTTTSSSSSSLVASTSYGQVLSPTSPTTGLTSPIHSRYAKIHKGRNGSVSKDTSMNLPLNNAASNSEISDTLILIKKQQWSRLASEGAKLERQYMPKSNDNATVHFACKPTEYASENTEPVRPAEYISRHTFHRFLEFVRPDLLPEHVDVIFNALDLNHQNYIEVREWLRLVDLIDASFQVSTPDDYSRYGTGFNHHNVTESCWKRFVAFMRSVMISPILNVVIDIYTFTTFVLLLLVTENTLEFSHTLFYIYSVLIYVSVGEMVLKVIFIGGKRCFRRWLFRFDLLIIAIVLIFKHLVNVEAKWYHILAFRFLRVSRHLHQSGRYRAIILTVKRLYPALRTLVIILGSVYYFFSLIGISLFRNLIVKDKMDEKFMETYYAQNNYWENNFDNLPHAFVTLFEIMIINNWNLTVEGFTVAAKSNWPRVFFVCFFFCSVVVVMNVVVALVLEAFISKYNVKEGEEDEIDDDGNVIRVSDDLDSLNMELLTTALQAYADQQTTEDDNADIDLTTFENEGGLKSRTTSRLSRSTSLSKTRSESHGKKEDKMRKLWQVVLKKRTQRLYKMIFDSKQ